VVTKTDEELTPAPVAAEWMNQRPSTAGHWNINPIYWQKKDGWIVVGPGLATAQADLWKKKGCSPLLDYSYTDRTNARTGERQTIEPVRDRLGTIYRYYWLFKNGGARLFTIQQIVAHHWHIEPPYGLPKSVFPQLAEWDVPEPLWCAACVGNSNPFNSENELLTHAMIAHRMTLPQARDLLPFARERPRERGAVLAIRKKTKAIEAEVEKRESEPAPTSKPRTLVVCDCGQVFSNGLDKYRHVKKGECPRASVSASDETQEE
jgi:hypothetical protein